jgi:hypothetical protein
MATADAAHVNQVSSVTVNIGINYGSGPVEWHNDTVVPYGQDLLNATMQVAAVEFTSYAGLGAFVTGINGVRQDPAASLYWMFWVYNPETQQYEMAQFGASAYMLTSDQTIQWYYEDTALLPRPYTTVSLNVRLDSSNPSIAIISGSVSPNPGAPVNVTLEYSSDQGTTYQGIARITSASDGSFGYSWQLPTSGVFLTRAEAQGVRSNVASVGAGGGGVPGFPLESLLLGGVLGMFLLALGHRSRRRSRDDSN